MIMLKTVCCWSNTKQNRTNELNRCVDATSWQQSFQHNSCST